MQLLGHVIYGRSHTCLSYDHLLTFASCVPTRVHEVTGGQGYKEHGMRWSAKRLHKQHIKNDKKIGENKNNNIYKETIPKLDILSKNDNQEEKAPNEKDSDQKKHKKDKKQKNKKNTLQLFFENNE